MLEKPVSSLEEDGWGRIRAIYSSSEYSNTLIPAPVCRSSILAGSLIQYSTKILFLLSNTSNWKESARRKLNGRMFGNQARVKIIEREYLLHRAVCQCGEADFEMPRPLRTLEPGTYTSAIISRLIVSQNSNFTYQSIGNKSNSWTSVFSWTGTSWTNWF